jgi:hypothetical protein
MTLPTVNDVQAVEEVLTNFAVGYMQSLERFVASRVFPPVPTDKDSGTYYIHTKKYWFLDEMEERAPGQEYARMDFGLSTATFKTKQWALDAALPDEIEANSQVPGSLSTKQIQLLAQRSLIRKERAFAADFFTTGVWTTTDNNSATDWDDYSAGDPVNDILGGKLTISQLTGLEPNTLTCGHIVHNALINHPDLIDRIKHTQAATVGNMNSAIASILDIANYWPSKASYNTANEGQTFSGSAIIDDDALLVYVDPSPNEFSATGGLTFNWDGGGGMGQIASYRDEKRDAEVLKWKEQWDQKVVAADVGKLWLDIV